MFYKRQTWFFLFISVLFICPYLLLHGTNIVTHTYQFAATQLFKNLSPYIDPKGQGDFFKYSPFFCVFYYPIALLGKNLEAFVWGLVNISVYWIGVTRWVKLESTSSKWLWFAFLACSMELDGSVRYQQFNAFLVGITLIGVAFYREENYFSSGLLLSIGTNMKILPILFLCALLIPLRKRYLLGTLCGFLVTFLVPALVVGWTNNIPLHQEWITVLYKDLYTTTLLDLATILSRYGVENPRLYYSLPIGIVTAAFLLASRLYPFYFSWKSFIALGLLSLLLLSPRTESPTFVLAGPCYVLLISEALKTEKMVRVSLLTSILMGIALVTLTMNDIWPRFILDVSPLRYANKTFGILVLWFSALSLVSHQLISKVPRKTVLEV